MSSNKALLIGLGICAGFLAACSNNDHPNASLPGVPGPQTPETLDTAQVLALARNSSEPVDPFAVNGGLITIAGTSETSSPISVDGM